MMIPTYPTIARAHRWMIASVVWYHQEIITEDGEKTWEGKPTAVTISQPLADMIHPLSSFQEQRCNEYAKHLIYGSGSDFDYTYHDRFFNYPGGDSVTIRTDQIECLIDHLKNHPTTRRAFAVTWDPFEDPFKKNVPCLQTLQFLSRNDKLNLITTWRSEDVLSAAGPNMYGLVRLLEHVAAALCVPVGTYTHIVTVPHLYPVRDASELKRWM